MWENPSVHRELITSEKAIRNLAYGGKKASPQSISSQVLLRKLGEPSRHDWPCIRLKPAPMFGRIIAFAQEKDYEYFPIDLC
jgi:hypothetical protein